MKARCKKELRFQSFTFEVGKEYDFECKVFVRERDDKDPVLARGHKVRHLQYSTKIEVKFASLICGTEKVPLTVHFYDRNFCVKNGWHVPANDPLCLLPDEELYCFEDFFVEEYIEMKKAENKEKREKEDRPMITSYYVSRHTATGIYYIILNTEDRWIEYMVNKCPYQGGLSVTFYKGEDDVTEDINIDSFNVFDYHLLSRQEKDQIVIVCLPLKMIREFEIIEGGCRDGLRGSTTPTSPSCSTS